MKLQVSWLVDYTPPWLGPSMLFFGVVLCAISGVTTVLSETTSDVRSSKISLGRFQAGMVGFIIGLTLAYLPFYFRHSSNWALIFFLWGRWLEGIAAPRFLIKIAGYLSGSSNSSSGISSVSSRATYYFVLLFILILAGWGTILAIFVGPFSSSLIRDILVIWTILTFSVSALGVFWWFRDANMHNITYTFDNLSTIAFPTLLLLGMMLGIGGAQIYNYSTALTDIAALIGGNIVYSIGYWGMILVWLGSNN